MRTIPIRTALGALAVVGVLGAGAVAAAAIGDGGTPPAKAPAPASAFLAGVSTDDLADAGFGDRPLSSVSLPDLVAVVEDLGFDPAQVMAAAMQAGSAADVAAALGIERAVLIEALDAAATAGVASLQGDGQIDADLAEGLRAQLPAVLPFLVDLDARGLTEEKAEEKGAAGLPGTGPAVPHELPEELEGLAALEEHADGVVAEPDPAAVRAAVLAGADAALDVLVDHRAVPAAGADSVRGRLPALLDALMADVTAGHGPGIGHGPAAHRAAGVAIG